MAQLMDANFALRRELFGDPCLGKVSTLYCTPRVRVLSVEMSVTLNLATLLVVFDNTAAYTPRRTHAVCTTPRLPF